MNDEKPQRVTGYGDEFFERIAERYGPELADRLREISNRNDALDTLRDSADEAARRLGTALGYDTDQAFRDIDVLREIDPDYFDDQ